MAILNPQVNPSGLDISNYNGNTIHNSPLQLPIGRNKQKEKQKQKQKVKQSSNVKDIDLPAIGRCIFVVGKILEICDHPNADSMYIEKIDIGEDEPRTICSGIKGKITKEEMVNSYVIVFSNLKKAKLRGVESNGMILAA
eukprot:924481_1